MKFRSSSERPYREENAGREAEDQGFVKSNECWAERLMVANAKRLVTSLGRSPAVLLRKPFPRPSGLNRNRRSVNERTMTLEHQFPLIDTNPWHSRNRDEWGLALISVPAGLSFGSRTRRP